MVHSSCFLLDMRRVTHTVKSAKCHVDDQGDQGQGHVDDKGVKVRAMSMIKGIRVRVMSMMNGVVVFFVFS